ncbi:hypothetical protein F5X99DRAFT_407542 [Biscogniauxia marginata]|nr:hypothetical protein F5X99DRAFT_407542 [Biscogniauxia marginata]
MNVLTIIVLIVVFGPFLMHLWPFIMHIQIFRWIVDTIINVIKRIAQFIASLMFFLFTVRVFRGGPSQSEGRRLMDMIIAMVGAMSVFCVIFGRFIAAAAPSVGFCLGLIWPTDHYRRFMARVWDPSPSRTDQEYWEDVRAKYFGNHLWREVRWRCGSREDAVQIVGIMLIQSESDLIRCITDENFLNHRFQAAAIAYYESLRGT